MNYMTPRCGYVEENRNLQTMEIKVAIFKNSVKTASCGPANCGFTRWPTVLLLAILPDIDMRSKTATFGFTLWLAIYCFFVSFLDGKASEK